MARFWSFTRKTRQTPRRFGQWALDGEYGQESAAQRLGRRGGPYYRSPDNSPDVRIAMLRAAGECRVPFTTGIMVGIGETRAEQLEDLALIAELHLQYGHIQEVIVQKFFARSSARLGRGMPSRTWTSSAARRILGPRMNIQTPPNLSRDNFNLLLSAGVNDWAASLPRRWIM